MLNKMLHEILQFIQIIRPFITPSLASVGCVLGIYNILHVLRKDRIRIKVIPRINEPEELAIYIMNKSYLTVTINQISLIVKRPKDKRAKVSPIFLNGPTFPKTMEPRTSWTARLSLSEHIVRDCEIAYVKHVVVETACGKKFKGTSKSLKQYTKPLRKSLES